MEGTNYATYNPGLNDSSAPTNNEELRNGGSDNFNNEAEGNCNLIVNYLPYEIDDVTLREMFQPFGEIFTTKVVCDKDSKRSLGYGFVKFGNEGDAARAMENLNGYPMGHKILKVSIARPPTQRNCKLYIANLPKEYSEQDVFALLEPYGQIVECRVLKDHYSQMSKGVAFVTFRNKADADNVLTLQGRQLTENDRELIVRYADERRAPNNPVDVNRTNVPSHHQQPGGGYSGNSNGGGGGSGGPYPSSNYRNPRNQQYGSGNGFTDSEGMNQQPQPPYARSRQQGSAGSRTNHVRRQGQDGRLHGEETFSGDGENGDEHGNGHGTHQYGHNGNTGSPKPPNGNGNGTMTIHTNFDPTATTPFPPSYAKSSYGGNTGNGNGNTGNTNGNTGNGRSSSLSINTNMHTTNTTHHTNINPNTNMMKSTPMNPNTNTNNMNTMIPTTPTIQSNHPTNGYNTYLYANHSYLHPHPHHHPHGGLVLPSPGMSPFGAGDLPPHIFFPPSPMSPMPHPYGPPSTTTGNGTGTNGNGTNGNGINGNGINGNGINGNGTNGNGNTGTGNSGNGTNGAGKQGNGMDGNALSSNNNTNTTNTAEGQSGGFPSPYGYATLPPGVSYATFQPGPPGSSSMPMMMNVSNMPHPGNMMTHHPGHHPGMSPMGMNMNMNMMTFPMQGPPPLLPTNNSTGSGGGNTSLSPNPHTGMPPFPGFFHPSSMDYHNGYMLSTNALPTTSSSNMSNTGNAESGNEEEHGRSSTNGNGNGYRAQPPMRSPTRK